MSEFIFMLTRADETIPDAVDYVKRLGDSGVRHVGFKDVGLEEAGLREVVAAIRANGQLSYLEVVDVGSDAELRSAEAALRLGVDYLVGGTRIEQIAALTEDAPLRFFPYVGDVVGHPARLEGDRARIVAEAEQAAAHPAVDGINLLAYRWQTGDGAELAAAVVEAVDVPVIAAGSVDSPERIQALNEAGVWGFTIGSAILSGEVIPGAAFEGQISGTLEAAAR
jgi:NAD(P)H-dependent flavin oxidoreductase YrpB (nitropropane dioxygenase family)